MKTKNMEKKLKIVWICHFSNEMVRQHLPLDNRKLYNFTRKLLGMPSKEKGYGDVASWNTTLFEYFKLRDDVELTVISAHGGLKKNVVNFFEEGIHYYFVKCDYATLLKRLIKSPSLWHKLNPMRPIVKNIVDKINPDIVALMGAENAYISGTALGLEKKYPCIFKAQTIYNNPNREKFGSVDPYNAYVERLIFDAFPYASVSTKMHYDLYRTFRKDSYNFQWRFGTTFFPVEQVKEKEFDFVNFANSMIPAKGYPDAIKALAIVKKTHPDVKLNLVGTPTPDDAKLYYDLVQKLGLEDNVSFTPSFKLQKDVFQHIQKARYALLPYKLDYISSTTWQAMYYEMPVICYKTMGTPTINKDKECILIADMENVESLAEKMLVLLDNPQKAEELRLNAKEKVDAMNDGKKISDEIVRNFRAIVNHYNNGTPIPKEYLLDF